MPRASATVILLFMLLVMAAPARADDANALPAFPGAEGFGATTIGGRGGRVIKVTNLNSKGPGSLQAACAAKGPRIVVFEVAGVIKGPVVISQPNITIAGQTAPGAGITIVGRFSTQGSLHDVVIRFLRVRPSGRFGKHTPDDAIQMPGLTRAVFDHVSAAWGIDETIDLFTARDVTVQWCTIEESEKIGESIHNCGLITGPAARNITIHHNLFAHHRSRNPAMQHGPGDVRNNVVYDFRDGFTQYEDFPAEGGFNLVGNYYAAGPSDPDIYPFNFTTHGRYFLRDNYIAGVGVIQDPWKEKGKHPGLAYYAHKGTRLASAVPTPRVTTHQPLEALRLVLARAGCFPRDTVTRRTVHEVRTKGGRWGRNEPDDLMEGLTVGSPPRDSDGDGMPDRWEIQRGLDPGSADHNRVMASGYTAIEEYINELARELVERGDAGAAEGPAIEDGPTADTVLELPPGATDAEVSTLAGRRQLEVLSLRGTAVSDRGMVHLKGLTKLRVLNLHGTAISDAGLVHVSALAQLQALDLAGTAVTDAGLKHLMKLSNLRLLDVPAAISDAALAELKKALPRATITRKAD